MRDMIIRKLILVSLCGLDKEMRDMILLLCI
jgi:hypothetical protein